MNYITNITLLLTLCFCNVNFCFSQSHICKDSGYYAMFNHANDQYIVNAMVVDKTTILDSSHTVYTKMIIKILDVLRIDSSKNETPKDTIVLLFKGGLFYENGKGYETTSIGSQSNSFIKGHQYIMSIKNTLVYSKLKHPIAKQKYYISSHKSLTIYNHPNYLACVPVSKTLKSKEELITYLNNIEGFNVKDFKIEYQGEYPKVEIKKTEFIKTTRTDEEILENKRKWEELQKKSKFYYKDSSCKCNFWLVINNYYFFRERDFSLSSENG